MTEAMHKNHVRTDKPAKKLGSAIQGQDKHMEGSRSHEG